MKQWPNLRDFTLFVTGLLGVGHETLLSHTERPTLLILFAAMMGLPAFLRADGKAELPKKDEPKEVESAKEEAPKGEGE